MRLNRYLAAAGIASRRGADELIASGRVTVNGKVCRDFHFQPADDDYVKVSGKLVRPREHVYIALHKPAGFVCTRSDPHATDTIYDLLPGKFSRLFYIGRLDAQSEGLLLLTNDGEFAERISHPRYHLDKEYDVTLNKPATPELAQRLLRGTNLEGKPARAGGVHQIGPAKLRIVLQQGINRQIRRMLERFGYRAKGLQRIRIGNLRLGDLPRGHWRMLTKRELNLMT